MDKRPIGVFDSGLGGLTAVRQLLELMPNEDIIYFGDTGRVPYGTRSRETIKRYAAEDSAFLLSKGVKMIIAACGTVSSVAVDCLSDLSVPAIGVVEATAKAAADATKNGRVGVLGTAATIRSEAFQQALLTINPALAITPQPCPLFVPLVESGWISPEDPVTKAMVARYMEPIKAAGVDTLILGCTHFPLLAPAIRQELGESVTLIDSGRETAIRCSTILKEQGLTAPEEHKGTCHFFVSDRPEGFTQVAESFLGRCVQEAVEMIAPEALKQKGCDT